ncbi:GNAT family N-acetyltransferase [Falsiphaeobacter marinintestinus]|uniref:GNAT family N-acetyltransferase n=1 Tax=Falsiphaeobacter marinintestinus TaxID=1492905 RepID=UPI0011B75EF5|nr:GNAT family N-acetyltransferase [Phaeobacter marinintestinus]
MTLPKIRSALPGDLPALVDMIAALAAHHDDSSPITPAALSRDLFSSPAWAKVLVAEDRNGQLAGYAALLPRYRLQFGQKGLDLHHLFIRPDWRGQGLGKQLIKACLAIGQEMGCKAMTVGTAPENETAQDIYAHLGFRPSPASGPTFVYPLE